MILRLPGHPIHKVRHRSCIRSGRIHSYDTQGIDKEAIAWSLKSLVNAAMHSDDDATSAEAFNLLSFDYYVVSIEFHLMPPISLSTKQRTLLCWNAYHLEKPDLDNLVKFYLDVGNKILWHDDKKIVELKATKIYSEFPATVITVEGRKKMEDNTAVQGILGTFPPNRYYDMLSDLRFLAEIENTPNRSYEKKAADAAYIISRFADTYSDELRKIKKNYPGFWKEFNPNIYETTARKV